MRSAAYRCTSNVGYVLGCGVRTEGTRKSYFKEFIFD